MKTRRARFIAAQAVLTAILMGVIVVTLINPKDENTLFAVDVPGPGPQVTQESPRYEPPENPGGQGRDDGSDTGAESGSAVGSAGAAGTAAQGTVPQTPVAPSSTPGGSPEGGSDGGPPDEQYGDTLARLDDALD